MLDQQDREAARLQLGDQRLISAVSVWFMPAVGSSSSSSRGRSASARAISTPAAIGVGQAVGGLVEPRHQPVAEQGEDARRLRRGAPPPRARTAAGRTSASASSASGPEPGRVARRAEPRVGADQHVVEHAEIAEHAAVLEGAGEAERARAARRAARYVCAVEAHRARRRARRGR